MTKPLWQWSVCDIAAAIRAKDISCVEATEAAVARMQRVLRGVGKRDEPLKQPADEPASIQPDLSGEPSTLGMRESSGGM